MPRKCWERDVLEWRCVVLEPPPVHVGLLSQPLSCLQRGVSRLWGWRVQVCCRGSQVSIELPTRFDWSQHWPLSMAPFSFFFFCDYKVKLGTRTIWRLPTGGIVSSNKSFSATGLSLKPSWSWRARPQNTAGIRCNSVVSFSLDPICHDVDVTVWSMLRDEDSVCALVECSYSGCTVTVVTVSFKSVWLCNFIQCAKLFLHC